MEGRSEIKKHPFGRKDKTQTATWKATGALRVAAIGIRASMSTQRTRQLHENQRGGESQAIFTQKQGGISRHFHYTDSLEGGFWHNL